MTTIYYERDADLDQLRGRSIAVVVCLHSDGRLLSARRELRDRL